MDFPGGDLSRLGFHQAELPGIITGKGWLSWETLRSHISSLVFPMLATLLPNMDKSYYTSVVKFYISYAAAAAILAKLCSVSGEQPVFLH